MKVFQFFFAHSQVIITTQRRLNVLFMNATMIQFHWSLASGAFADCL